MKKNNTCAIGKWVFPLIVIVLAIFMLTGRTQAQGAVVTTTNDLTFNQPVALPGVVLPAGTYTFESLVMGGNVVRVSNRSDGTVRFTGFTRRILRPKTISASTAVMFGEASPGAVPPISAWLPIGRTEGHEFMYR